MHFTRIHVKIEKVGAKKIVENELFIVWTINEFDCIVDSCPESWISCNETNEYDENNNMLRHWNIFFQFRLWILLNSFIKIQMVDLLSIQIRIYTGVTNSWWIGHDSDVHYDNIKWVSLKNDFQLIQKATINGQSGKPKTRASKNRTNSNKEIHLDLPNYETVVIILDPPRLLYYYSQGK